MVSSGMLRRVTLVITDISEETSASFIRVRRIGELGPALAATSNRTDARCEEICWGGVDWISLAQDRDRWRALVNAVMNLRVP
jgi:hypothetical protein